MERWPGHETQEREQITEKPKEKGKQRAHHVASNFWRWPHLEHGSIGRTTLVWKDGRVKSSSVAEASQNTRWLSVGRPVKVFPKTRPPEVNIYEHSVRKRAEKGLQYLRTYFPDADFPGEFLGDALEADTREMRGLKEFDPFLGNLLEVIPSHHTQNESTVAFPMGELRRELNISRFSSDSSGSTVFYPSGSPSFAFETPILQISSAVEPPAWSATPFSTILIRTHSSSSLVRLVRSEVTREIDITRSETGGISIVDSRVLASGPDIVVVNRNGMVYKCNTYHGGKAMQLIGAHEMETDNLFWQLGITRREEECFLTSPKAVKHIDFRSASPFADVFLLDHPSAIVTSFETPMKDYIGRIATTSDVIWIDDRFRRRPLLSYKHYRSFDRTLRVLTANLSGASFSLLTSRRNGLVTLYDISRGSDNLLHCNSNPSCLPRHESILTEYGGHALVVLPSDVDLSFLRLCQRGSIERQDIRVARPDDDQPGSDPDGRATHQWDEDVEALERKASKLQIDFGPAGGRHYTEVNLRGAYEKIFAIADGDTQLDPDSSASKTLLRLSDIWQDKNLQETAESMLTAFDVMSEIEDGNKHESHADFLASDNFNSKQVFDALIRDELAVQELADLALWHYYIHETSLPGLGRQSVNCKAMHEHLNEVNLASGAGRHDVSVRREAEARELLAVDLALSNDVYSARPVTKPHSFSADEATANATARPTEISYGKEPPKVEFGYFRPVRKAGADHYADKGRDGEPDANTSDPLGVRLLLAEWELGTDPKDYTYRDPYGVVEAEAQPVPQYRRLPVALSTRQKRQTQPQRPPVVAPATQPLIERECLPTARYTEEAMTNTQVVPGRYGGRPGWGKGAGRGQRRLGGF